jgi:hypothetical protein
MAIDQSSRDCAVLDRIQSGRGVKIRGFDRKRERESGNVTMGGDRSGSVELLPTADPLIR